MIQMTRVRVMVCVLVSVILMVGGAFALDDSDSRKIVIFVDGVPLLTQQLIVTATGSTIVHTLSLINALAIDIPLESITSVLQVLLSDPRVLGVFDDPIGYVDYSATPAAAPPTEDYSWWFEVVHLPEVHAQLKQMNQAPGSGVTVAILDTGIDRDHPEFSSRIVDCFNALPGGGSCEDDNGHGTHIAGLIAAAENAQGVIGAASAATLAVVKVLDSNGGGRISDCVYGLQRVHSRGYRLVNMSLGFPVPNEPLKRAVDRLAGVGTIMVASVGNTNPKPSAAGEGGDGEGGDATCDPAPVAAGEGGDGEGGDAETNCYLTTNVKYPAAYADVVAVAAATLKDNGECCQIANYSRMGDTVDLAASGGSKDSWPILSTNKGDGYGWASGTSQAAAHVTGAVALAMQRRASQGLPALTFAQILELLQTTAIDLHEGAELQGAGLLDAEGLMNSLQ
ncbi:MAG TPA: S8 family serine peptidase [Candidatus Tectomicrobia bacterium]|nr:S8 family serine peptidase [Candidatus Tectomicrobia bacterium]